MIFKAKLTLETLITQI